ncbi:tetratricopeptide repeat protein [Phenylobacterium aquaticum]|uniref:tetratricopeptide repeat protein n=1 Tax=Phenylobacterium aquaticum TaxID=1763816 RepID=UPI0026F0B400|nr:tetratricopeptide repeat protein [Phenylobacterium aquaticum]
MLNPIAALAGDWASSAGAVVRSGLIGGQVVFQLGASPTYFEVDTAGQTDPQALLTVLRDSSATGKSVIVRYGVDSGWFDPKSELHFQIHDLNYGGQTYIGRVKPRMSPAPSAEDLANSALAQGIALRSADEKTKARAALDDALRDDHLRPFLLPLALLTRADLLEEMAFDTPSGTPRDQLLFQALLDAKRWMAMAPAAPNAASAVARAFGFLGDYDRALAMYSAMVETWPDKAFWYDINISAIYRVRGQFPQALAALDDIVARNGPQSGMAFHYHRGRILLEQKRWAEAADEFTIGLKAQPDFSYAFIYRSCANAQLGRLQQAIEDETSGLDILNRYAERSSPTSDREINRARVANVLVELRNLAAKDPRLVSDAPCTGLYDAQTFREPSPLLAPLSGKLS